MIRSCSKHRATAAMHRAANSDLLGETPVLPQLRDKPSDLHLIHKFASLLCLYCAK